MVSYSDKIHIQSHHFDLSEIEDFLLGVDYPATKREVLDVALDNGTPDDMLMFLNTMPDQEYLNFTHLAHILEQMLS